MIGDNIDSLHLPAHRTRGSQEPACRQPSHPALACCKLSMSLPAPAACDAQHGSCMIPMHQVACLLLLGLRRGQQKVEPCLSSLLGTLPAEGLIGLHIFLLLGLPLQQIWSSLKRLPTVAWTCGHQECLLCSKEHQAQRTNSWLHMHAGLASRYCKPARCI